MLMLMILIRKRLPLSKSGPNRPRIHKTVVTETEDGREMRPQWTLRLLDVGVYASTVTLVVCVAVLSHVAQHTVSQCSV